MNGQVLYLQLDIFICSILKLVVYINPLATQMRQILVKVHQFQFFYCCDTIAVFQKYVPDVPEPLLGIEAR